MLHFRPAPPPPPGLPGHCAPTAVRAALEIDYRAAWRALGSPVPDDIVLVPVMAAYLRRHGAAGTWSFDRVPLAGAAGLACGRLICLTEIVRNGRPYGHYVAVIDGVLHDWADTRDGLVVRAWPFPG